MSNSKPGPSKEAAATPNPEELMDELIVLVEKDGTEAPEGEKTDNTVEEEEVVVEEKEGGDDGGEKAKPVKKAKNPRKQLQCGETGCDYVVGYKAKMDAHLEKVHNKILVKKPRKSTTSASASAASSSAEPTPTGKNKTITLSSSEGSPELAVVQSGKKRKCESVLGLEESRNLRAKLEKLQKEPGRNTEKSKVPAKKEKDKNNIVKMSPENKFILMKRIKELEESLAQKSQEADDQRSKAKGMESKVDELTKENQEWQKTAKHLVEGDNIDIKATMEKAEKTIEDKTEQIEIWRGVSKAQFIAMDEITKNSKAAFDKIKHYESRMECRDFKKGRCLKNPCKYYHVVEETRAVMAQQNQVTQGMPDNQGGRPAQAQAQAQGEPPLQPGHCVHFERGNCRFGNTCRKIHVNELYGTRKRSGSHGSSNQGFQKPLRSNQPGGLGAVMESPDRIQQRVTMLPDVRNPAMSAESRTLDVERMEIAAKKGPKDQEKMVYEQLKQMKVDALLGAATWEEMEKAFRTK